MTSIGISTQLARILLYTLCWQWARSWEVTARWHRRTRTEWLRQRQDWRRASKCDLPGNAWKFGPGNGRAAGGLCDCLRNEFRDAPNVCGDGLRASIKRPKVSQGSEHVDPWNSGRLGLFRERVRRVEPDFARSPRLRREKFAGSEGRSCNPGSNIATGTA